MPYNPTVVLGLPIPDTFSKQSNDLQGKLNNDQLLSSSHQQIDQFAALITGSACFSLWALNTGSVSDFNLFTPASNVISSEVNRTCDRVLLEAWAWAQASGSGGVTTVDIQVGGVGNGNFQSVFASTASMLAVSSSLGNYVPAKSNAFVSGTNTRWPLNTMLRCQLLTAAGGTGLNAQSGLTVQLFWKPSGSAATVPLAGS